MPVNAAHVLRIISYSGCIPDEGELMRCIKVGHGYLELQRVEASESTYIAQTQSEEAIPNLREQDVKNERDVEELGEPGSSAANPLDLMNIDDIAREEEDDADDSDEDIPLAQVVATSRTVAPTSVSLKQEPSTSRRKAGPSTEEERIDMAGYIFGLNPATDMRKSDSWRGFLRMKEVSSFLL